MDISDQLDAKTAFTPGKEPWFPLIEQWVGPRATVDGFQKEKISCPCRDSIPGPFNS